MTTSVRRPHHRKALPMALELALTPMEQARRGDEISLIVQAMREQVRGMGRFIDGRDRVHEDTAAVLLGEKPKTLRNWRYLRDGPCWTRSGGRVLYSLEALAAWEWSLTWRAHHAD